MELSGKRISLPISREDVLSLRAGDCVLLSGNIATGRDKLHRHLFHKMPPKEAMPYSLEGGLLYHCGPIVRQSDKGFDVLAAGPTTSNRVEMYEPWVIEHYGLRAVMGKGGMGKKTHEAMVKFGCVYLNAIGGAAAYLADRVKAVKGVWMLEEFGMAEAMWVFEVEDFPAFVTMDAHGKSLHEAIERASLENLLKLAGK